MNSKFRQVLIASGALVAALAVALLAQPMTLDKSDVERAVSEATGRPFTVSGALRLSLLPVPMLRAESVALANLKGFHSTDLITARELRLRVRLIPLFFGRVEVFEAVLERPAVALEVDGRGRANWSLLFVRKPSHHAHPTRTRFKPGMTLRIEDGTLDYADARTRRDLKFDRIAATLRTQDGSAVAQGRFRFRGHDIDVSVLASPGSAPARSQPFHLAAKLNSDLVQLTYAGTIAADGAAGGRLQLRAASLKGAGDWLGVDALKRLDDEALSLKGTVEGGGRVYRFEGMRMKLGGATVTGNLAADLRGERLRLAGDLEADNLVLFQSASNRGHASHPSHGTEGWSRAPISLSFLHQADARLSIASHDLRLGKLALQRAQLDAVQEDGKLQAKFSGLRLYGGTGSAVLALDDTEASPKWAAQAQFDDVDLMPFLVDTIGVKSIAGKGTIAIQATARGAAADMLMHSLSGTGQLAFHGGRIAGIDLGSTAHAIQSVLNQAVGPGSLTDYAAIHARFALTDGVLESHDLDLQGPLIHMSGTGTVDLGDRRIDFRLVPQATAELGENSKVTLGLPLRLQGPWSHIRAKVDAGSLADAVARNLASGRAPFKGVFGPPANPRDQPKKKKHKNLGDALKNMLGIH